MPPLAAALVCFGNEERSEEVLCSSCAMIAAGSPWLAVDCVATVLAGSGASVAIYVNGGTVHFPMVEDLSAVASSVTPGTVQCGVQLAAESGSALHFAAVRGI